MDSTFTVNVRKEEHLRPETLSGAFESFPTHWREIPGNGPDRAWTRQEPAYRVVAEDINGEFIGQIGLVEICSDPEILGVSDASVCITHRERGVATALLEAACAFADAMDRNLMIATSNEGLRRVCHRLGFYQITDHVTLDGYNEIPESWMGRGNIRGAVVNDLF